MAKIKFTNEKLEKLEKRVFELFDKSQDKVKVGKLMKLSEIQVLYLLLFSRDVQYNFFNGIQR
jgi:hypothetical protein